MNDYYGCSYTPAEGFSYVTHSKKQRHAKMARILLGFGYDQPRRNHDLKLKKLASKFHRYAISYYKRCSITGRSYTSASNNTIFIALAHVQDNIPDQPECVLQELASKIKITKCCFSRSTLCMALRLVAPYARLYTVEDILGPSFANVLLSRFLTTTTTPD